MRQNRYFANFLLAILAGLMVLAMILCKTFIPAAVLPHWSIPTFCIPVLLALLLEAYIAPEAARSPVDRLIAAILGGAALALLPGMAGFVEGNLVWAVFAAGFVVFGVCDVLFAAIRDRIASGPVAKAAPALSAVLLYLAVQGLSGMIF